jgi:hypothetical protein
MYALKRWDLSCACIYTVRQAMIGVEKEPSLVGDWVVLGSTLWINTPACLFSSKQKRDKDTLALKKCWKRPLKPFENAV